MKIQNILEDLIKIQSVSSNTKECRRIVDYIDTLVKENGLKSKIYENKDVFSILIGKEIKDKYEVLFNGHLDVVPANQKDFQSIIKKENEKNIMYGRGTSDMKGACVSVLTAFIESIKEGVDLDMAILFTTDEEIGGFNGVKYILDNDIVSADIVFIPDGGNNWSICTDEKGVFQIRLTATGVSAHGSKVWEGDNAILKLIKVYNNISKRFDKVTEKDNWKPTVNLGALNGGDAANKVPDIATMLLDMRYPTPYTQKDLEKIVNESLVKEVTYEAISTGSPLHIDIGNKYLKKWIKIVDNPEFEKASGASDGRFFAGKGIPVLITKPISSDPHINNEWVDLDDLDIFKKKIKEWLRSI
ncbi:MAG: M20/M25/M40 family metallo-hydrolase [Candidatus Dojkabacteria bacterium]|nr:M20/M25/M40 family metallo-hydrolase [Candidatus Dojkabacteria bacterium]